MAKKTENTERTYSAEIMSVHGVELSKKEQLALTIGDNSTAIDAEAENGSFVITDIKGYVVLGIHNEKANGDKDYTKYVILTENGNYSTGSESFMNTFINIFNQMEGEKDWGIEVIRKPSKNYNGKYFLSCTVV